MENEELFEKCLKFVLKAEGGFVNHPNDLGGVTNKGVTQRTYNEYLIKKNRPAKSVKYITDAEVKEIFYKDYWLAANCHKMTPKFAALCFDTAVNMGVGRCGDFLRAAEWKYPEKFIEARKAKYYKFAENPTQKVFLQGWLNRLANLKEFIKSL